ncbi:MAG: hypothetical protein K2Q18_17035 [Bdellovibrionales bacterium]|nr:hypothetical protein [Bdellovibrionales bacterium]
MKTFNLKKVGLFLLVGTQLLSTESFASAKFQQTLLTNKREAILDPYFQLKSHSVKELTDEESIEFINEDKKAELTTKSFGDVNLPKQPKGNAQEVTELVAATGGGASTSSIIGVLDGVIMVVDKLIAIGQKIIPTIEKGKAVVTNNPMTAVSVLPRLDTKDPVLHDMGGWSIPVTKHYKIAYKNGYGSEVISFIYSVTYQYGGSHDGKGRYLTGIRASARNITVSWGFDLDATSQLIQISNVGTQDKVVAGATVEISYTVKNWTRQITTNESFFVAGDGRLFKLD